MSKYLMQHLILLMMFFTASCINKEIKPQDPLWERESCARCRMVLSEKRFAVQRFFQNSEALYYDDLICALKHNHGKENGVLYVRPYGADEWVPAEEAKYVSGLRTPMNSGYGAVKEGGVINFSEIKERFKNKD